MRVTKTVHNYIEKEVYARLKPKYAAEEKISKEQKSAREEFLQAAAHAAQEAYNQYFDEHFPEISSFCTDKRNSDTYACRPNCYAGNSVSLNGERDISSVHGWNSRLSKEASAIIEDIVVTLELGGTKAELAEMLEKVGKE